jgi:hypothetical protein
VEQGFLLQHSITRFVSRSRTPCKIWHLLAIESASYDMFLLNVGSHSPDCTENAPRRGPLKTATPKFCDFVTVKCVVRRTAMALESAVVCDITQYSPLKDNRCFGGIYRLHLQVWKLCRLSRAFPLASCSAYSWTLKMEAIYSSRTILDIQHSLCDWLPTGLALIDSVIMLRLIA